jgi:hypothetical protein
MTFFILYIDKKRNMELVCEFCKKNYLSKIALVQHSIRCSENPNKIRTKHSDETKKKMSSVMKIANTNSKRIWKSETIEKMKIVSKEKNIEYWTDEKRQQHSLLMKSVVKNNPGSYSTNNVSGRAKIYEYKGMKLKGTWELKIASILDKYDIKWTNNIKPIPYYWNDGWHLYFPDFYLIEYDKYVEVKGYQRERDVIKWKSSDKPLVILKIKEVKALELNDSKILNYIKD